MRVRLGPFELHDPLARGGMGTVWRAEHLGSGVPVAVKVLDERASPALVQVLEHEVRTVAGLDHPHVIRVFEQGRVSGSAARLAGGALLEGSPWFAMELAEAGQLAWREVPRWCDVQTSLLSLLDALAHAHARGVLHRDLKPANVLFAATPTGRVLKLSDFGMGWTAGDETAPRTGGTPLYMAPEQFARDLAQQGPWTDLYSLGCLAFALVCRRPPFPRGTFDELRSAHRERPFPGLPQRAAAPEGFAAWLDGLVAKAPGDRYRRAADAAAVLAALPAEAADGDLPPDIATDELTMIPEGSASLPPIPVRSRGRPAAAPPAADWRPADAVPSAVPPGVGLGLFGLRPIPMVAREDERDLAWSLVLAVRDRRPRALVIEGPSGFGKSRLAQWLCERAEETGAAIALRATHGSPGDPADGLAGMVARHLRVPPHLGPLGFADWLGRVAATDPLGDAELLADLLAASSGPRSTGSREQRHFVLERFVRDVGRDRPVVVWIDGAQHALDALAWARRVLRADELPALLVVVVQEEELAERPDAVAAVQALRDNPRTTSLRLGPLGEGALRGLVRSTLGLEDELAAQIVARTRGNPMFAVQVVGEWVHQGRLAPAAGGFHLTGGFDELPASIAQLWRRRVATLVGPNEGWRHALEVAAALGPDVDRGEWRDACAHAGVGAPDELVERLLGLRLAETEPGQPQRFGFVHEMLRESVALDAATRMGRWHRACAAMLAERGAEERRARHLLAGGSWEEALQPLLNAAAARIRAGQPEIAADLLRRVRAALPPDHPAHAALLTQEAQVDRMYSRFADAKDKARSAVELGAAAPPAVQIRALQELAGLKLHTEPAAEEVGALLDRALTVARAAGLGPLVASLLLDRARAEEYYGHLAAAAATYRAAAAQDGVEEELLGLTESGLAGLALKEQRLDEALALATRADQRFEALGLRWHTLYNRMVLGEVARLRGDLALAASAFRAVIAAYERLAGRGQTALPRVNLALVYCAAGRFGEARAELDLALADAQRSGHDNLAWMARALATWAAAGLADWPALDRGLGFARELQTRELVDPDFGIAWREAGDLAAAAGERDRAALAWDLSAWIWDRLGDEARAAEIRARR